MTLRVWLGTGGLLGVLLALWPVVRGGTAFDPTRGRLAELAKKTSAGRAEKAASLTGLDLQRLDIRPGGVSAPLPGGRVAELTLDPAIQRAALRTMHKYRVPEAGVVALSVKTGQVLAYASQVLGKEQFDVNLRAEAPAASVFKVVTGSALVEKAGLSSETEQCYRGGRSQISADELQEDPRRDKWCATLGMAMGRSLNVVFGRLAQKHLTPEDLMKVGGAFGFGAPVPFPVQNEAPKIEIPEDPLEFARAAAGFWHTTLSPLAAAVLAQTIGNGGVTLEPHIVMRVRQGKDVLYEFPTEPKVLRRAVQKDTARQIAQMMRKTVSDGSAYSAFHDGSGRPFLPGIEVAGKTGTLTREKENRHYTWLVAFAPLDDPEIAVAAVVVNTPEWQIKGTHLARDVLRAHFAARGREGVSSP